MRSLCKRSNNPKARSPRRAICIARYKPTSPTLRLWTLTSPPRELRILHRRSPMAKRPCSKNRAAFPSLFVKKQKIESELAITASTIAVLESELDAAKQNADDLAIAIEHAAEAVVAKEAEQIATDFMTKLEALRREQYILAALDASLDSARTF